MKLSELKSLLAGSKEIHLRLPDGDLVPPHFHITEAGLITRNFIDCGGVIRKEKSINLQVWVANDTDHRIQSDKLIGILERAAPLFHDEDLEVEVEYQLGTIGRFQLGHDGFVFGLLPTHTNCLASDHCGIPSSLLPVESEPNPKAALCSPGGSCC